jgi:hypothetical protein
MNVMCDGANSPPSRAQCSGSVTIAQPPLFIFGRAQPSFSYSERAKWGSRIRLEVYYAELSCLRADEYEWYMRVARHRWGLQGWAQVGNMNSLARESWRTDNVCKDF